MIRLDKVSKQFRTGVFALSDISFEVEKGEFVFLVGPTGSGKTTIFRLLTRETLPTAGEIIVDNWDVVRLPSNKIAHLRKKIGVVFQDLKLLMDRTIFENIILPLDVSGIDTITATRIAEETMEKVGILSHKDKFPIQLSGGELQRAAIARALTLEPDILLADEPTGNLDSTTAMEIVKLLAEINKKGTTIIMATHNKDAVKALSKRVISLNKGILTGGNEKKSKAHVEHSEKKSAIIDKEKKKSKMKIFKTTWRNIRRSPYQAFAAVFVMALTFLAISFFTFLLAGSSKAISYFESRPQVTAFFKNEVKQADIDNLKTELMATNKVASVKFVSKEDALKIYREQNKNDPLLLELVTADILPASLEISTIKIEDLTAINNMLKDSPLVSEVVFQKDIVSVLTSWTNALRSIGLGLIIILSLVSIFIMVIIIGVKISQKKVDIEIMRLIGAEGWYIRWPFILEGISYGVVGAFLGWLISAGALWYATPFLSSFLKGMPIFPVPLVFFFGLLGAEILVAIVLGTLSSFLAVFRYLK